jgi:hypothetical protein
MLDTRMNLLLLLDYKEYYGIEKSLTDARTLLAGISSTTLLNYIAGFGVNLYLNENSDDAGKVQRMLVLSLLEKCGPAAIEKWQETVIRQANNGHSPMMFWNYSNLLFYGLIFDTFNSLPSRDLTGTEAQRVFDAYLIVNLHANNKVQIPTAAIEVAAAADRIEEVIMPNFIYQKDYASTTELTNQVVRGDKFFQYLESEPKYQKVILDFYKINQVDGYLEMFQNLFILFSKIDISRKEGSRKQLLDLSEYVKSGFVNLNYISKLCINNVISSYKEDISFGMLRNKFIFEAAPYRYFLLDINFLIDQFYKAQVFAFGAFLKNQKIKVDFLSEKGKNFTENIYLPFVLETCFPHSIKFFGEACINSKGEELCDAYIREGNKVCLIEFKDVLLNSAVKNSADKEVLYAELSKKFVANQQNSPKGLTQLWNAIIDIDTHTVIFDKGPATNELEIYPVVVYTDTVFGVEGINKVHKEQFKNLLANYPVNASVKEVTFINLNFFELREDYFAQKLLNIFTMLDAYHQHIQQSNYVLTPFEVFSRFYMTNYVPEELGVTQSYKAVMKKILKDIVQ